MKDQNKAAQNFEKEKKTYTFFYNILSGLFMKLYRVEVINPENEPLDQHFIVACNHTGAADGIIICAAMKNQIRFLLLERFLKQSVVIPLTERAVISLPCAQR